MTLRIAERLVRRKPIANRVWNLLLIAIRTDRQGSDLGTALIARLENELIRRGARLLVIETSRNPIFERTRSLYRRQGFIESACIPNYYDDGDDTVVSREHPG